jgi:hypothetical protein
MSAAPAFATNGGRAPAMVPFMLLSRGVKIRETIWPGLAILVGIGYATYHNESIFPYKTM